MPIAPTSHGGGRMRCSGWNMRRWSRGGGKGFISAPVPRTRVSGRDDGAAAGDRIQMVCDYCGGRWIELTLRWQFWSKRRLRLTPTGMFEIRSILSENRRVRSRRDNVIA